MRRAGHYSFHLAMVMALVLAPAGPATAYQRPATVERVSLAPDGAEADHYSVEPTISADGRYVAFRSWASNLVTPSLTNGLADVFVHDRRSGTTEWVSMTHDGGEVNASIFNAVISADGRAVAFRTAASNVIPDDTNDATDVFVHDRETGTTERVSVASDGTEANGHALTGVTLSADGRYVAFISNATNLVPGDTNDATDVFVHDRETGTTERVSVASDGTEANNHSANPVISAGGRYVAFQSNASNLVPDKTSNMGDVFVHDRESATTERVSVASDGTEANGPSSGPAITPDGRYVTFVSQASNLVPADTNGVGDLFIHDRETGVTERVSVASDGAEGDHHTSPGTISPDGRLVAFSSWAGNLAPGPKNCSGSATPGDTPCADVFVHDRDTGTTERVSVARDGDGGGNLDSILTYMGGGMSDAGRYIAFHSHASNLVEGDTNEAPDVFLYDRGPVIGTGAVDVQQASGQLTISGWATFSGAMITSADDPDDDASGVGPVSADDLGAELTGASVTYRREAEDLLLRLHVASLPSSESVACPIPVVGGNLPQCVDTGAGRPGIIYRVTFEAAGTRYEVRGQPGGEVGSLDDPKLAPSFAVYECDAECTESAQVSGTIGTTKPEVRIAVPLEAFGIEEGGALTGITASAAIGNAAAGSVATLDQVDLPDASIPVARVDLGIAPASTPEEEVAYTWEGDLAEGQFSRTLDVSSLAAGDYRVWARACLGEVCEGHAVALTL